MKHLLTRILLSATYASISWLESQRPVPAAL